MMKLRSRIFLYAAKSAGWTASQRGMNMLATRNCQETIHHALFKAKDYNLKW
jgi:hypothetical protein